jgi:hypothetical protein
MKALVDWESFHVRRRHRHVGRVDPERHLRLVSGNLERDWSGG